MMLASGNRLANGKRLGLRPSHRGQSIQVSFTMIGDEIVAWQFTKKGQIPELNNLKDLQG